MNPPFPDITIAGCGAVCAAGWGVKALLEASYACSATGVSPLLDACHAPSATGVSPLPVASQRGDLSHSSPQESSGAPRVAAASPQGAAALLPPPTLLKPPAGTDGPDRYALRVPAAPPLEFLRHPRLRRTSPISWFAAAAGMEAMAARPGTDSARLGLVFCVMNACVQYSGRFFSEVLRDPPTASPILFPETVFNAPGSHLAVLCGVSGAVTTLVGDRNVFFSGLEQASAWLQDGLVDACLVVAAEEADWLSAEALSIQSPGKTPGEGAAALLLERKGSGQSLAQLLRAGLPEIPGIGDCLGADMALKIVAAAAAQG